MRRVLLIAVAVCLAGLFMSAPAARAASLTSVTWSTSKSTTGATGTSYVYTFTIATAASLSSVTMSVPSGTGGSPTVGSVSPAALAGGAVSLAGTVLTYSFTAASVVTGQAVSIRIGGITNTATANSYTSVITTGNGSGPVDSGTSGTVTITSAALSNPTWSVSSAATGATGVTYTYGFSTLVSAFTTLTMTVPPGTSGTPTLGAISGISIGSVSLSGTTLTLSVLSVQIGPVSIEIRGLTNTPTAGSYTSEIVASPILGGSAVTPPVTFTGGLTLTSPGALGWSATIAGRPQSVVDPTVGHQQFSLDDETGSSAGWHITVAATTFMSGPNALPNSGTFVVTGSLASVTATAAPSSSCSPSCTPPANSTAYPVAITTATSPTPVTVYNAVAGSGIGPVTIGGNGAANPIGWWINVPANARAGSYAATITVAVVSGP